MKKELTHEQIVENREKEDQAIKQMANVLLKNRLNITQRQIIEELEELLNEMIWTPGKSEMTEAGQGPLSAEDSKELCNSWNVLREKEEKLAQDTDAANILVYYNLPGDKLDVNQLRKLIEILEKGVHSKLHIMRDLWIKPRRWKSNRQNIYPPTLHGYDKG